MPNTNDLIKPIDKLPSELWSYILNKLDPRDQSSTSAKLMVALPNAPIDHKFLYIHINLKNDKQVKNLNLKLISDKQIKLSINYNAYLGKSLRHSALLGDPQLLINVYNEFKHLELISIYVGPAFAPEHLKDFFLKPRNNLKSLIINFRPYLKRRSYYQFLKGAYFDSTLEHLSNEWPINKDLTRISFIQDNPPIESYKHHYERLPTKFEEENFELIDHSTYLSSYSGSGGTIPFTRKLLTDDLPKKFAHPIVFFNLNSCLSQFATSLLLSTVEHLRLRIPLRDVASSISVNGSLPNIRSLDLSTTFMRVNGPDANYANLLRRLNNLEYLILDQTDLLGPEANLNNLVARDKARRNARAVGQISATCGLVKSKMLQIAINEFVAEERAHLMQFNESNHNIIRNEEVNEEIQQQLNQPRRRINTSRRAFQANFSIRNTTENTQSVPRLSTAARAYLEHAPVEYLVLPQLPKLKSIGVGVPKRVKLARRSEWSREFKRGWNEGCLKVIENIQSSYKALMKSLEDESHNDHHNHNVHHHKTKHHNKYKTYGKSNTQSNTRSSNRNQQNRKKKIELITFDDVYHLPLDSTLPPSFLDKFPNLKPCPTQLEILDLLNLATEVENNPPVFCTNAQCDHPHGIDVDVNDDSDRNSNSSGNESENTDNENEDENDINEVINCEKECAHKTMYNVWCDV